VKQLLHILQFWASVSIALGYWELKNRGLLNRRLLKRWLLKRGLLMRGQLMRGQLMRRLLKRLLQGTQLMLLKGRLLVLVLLNKVELLYDCFHLNKTPADIQIGWTQDSMEEGPVL